MAVLQYLLLLITSRFLELGRAVAYPRLKIYFMAQSGGGWTDRVPFINHELTEFGLNKIELPWAMYTPGSIQSESDAVQQILAKVSQESNTASFQNVVLIYPYAATRSANLSIYEPLFSKALVIWFGTFLYNASVGPPGTVVVCPNDHKGGVFVARMFCRKARLSTNLKQLAVLRTPDPGFKIRYEGFASGLSYFCGDHYPDIKMIDVPLDESAVDNVGIISTPTERLMKSVFTTQLTIDSVFVGSEYVARGVIAAAAASRGHDADPDGLSGLLLNGWHNSTHVRPYLLRAKVYADVNRARKTNLAHGLANFLSHLDMHDLPETVLTAVEYVVPQMDGFVKQNILSGYDKLSKPPVKDEVEVQVAIEVVSISEIDSVNKNLLIIIDVILKWRDRRLKFRHAQWGGKITFFKNEIWLPQAEINTAIDEPKTFWYSMKSNYNGEVILRERVLLKNSCPTLDLADFPHDTQDCQVLVITQMPSALLDLKVASDFKFKTMKGSGFVLEKVSADVGSAGDNPYGNAVPISFTLTLSRLSGKYFVTHKIPGFLFVNIGFSGMWIPPGAVPARVALGVIVILTTLSLWSSLPRAGTLMDMWFLTNLGFLCITFLVTVAASNERTNNCMKSSCPCLNRKPVREHADPEGGHYTPKAGNSMPSEQRPPMTNIEASSQFETMGVDIGPNLRKMLGAAPQQAMNNASNAAANPPTPERKTMPEVPKKVEETSTLSIWYICCCGGYEDRIPDKLGRRFLPLLYLAATIFLFVLMETAK